MSHVYLVRHGQAGSRIAYDALSDAGRHQAELLGRWFAARQLRFHAAWTGTLQRQRDTAEAVRSAYLSAGAAFPDPQPHSGWDEFDLDAVYRSIAPVLRGEDESFRREHDAMLAELEAAGNHHGASIHRRWTACDVKIVQAWVSGRYGCEDESWLAFHQRVAECRRIWAAHAAREENIVVFTSATPIGVWCGLTLDLVDGRALRLAGALYNASFTVLETGGAPDRTSDVRILSFNNVPHLEAPELLTHR